MPSSRAPDCRAARAPAASPCPAASVPSARATPRSPRCAPGHRRARPRCPAAARRIAAPCGRSDRPPWRGAARPRPRSRACSRRGTRARRTAPPRPRECSPVRAAPSACDCESPKRYNRTTKPVLPYRIAGAARRRCGRSHGNAVPRRGRRRGAADANHHMADVMAPTLMRCGSERRIHLTRRGLPPTRAARRRRRRGRPPEVYRARQTRRDAASTRPRLLPNARCR